MKLWRRRTNGPRPARDFLLDVEGTVAEHGWVVVHIPDAAPPFRYTVGLVGQGIAEVIVFGCDAALGKDLLNDLGRRLVAGAAWADGAPIGELTEGGVVLQLHTVTREAPVGVAVAKYGPGIPVRQLVLPDQSGRMPWEPGARDAFAQPLLFDPPSASA